MVLDLFRTYYPEGVNGELYLEGKLICYTIELPWRDNLRNKSCIPEGKYVLKRRWSRKHGHHLQVTGVEGRSLILFHPANDALRELKGCIAPVSRLTGKGKGSNSRVAFEKVMTIAGRYGSADLVLIIRQQG